MNVNEIEAMALGRVANPDVVRGRPLRRELNGAYREMVQDIRDADTEMADDVQTFDLLAGINTYPTPANADSIRRVERFDLTGVGIANVVAVPCRRIPYQMLDRSLSSGSAAYCFAPTGIILIPQPANDYVGGLRITWSASAEELLEDNQTPRLPEPLHDPLAAKLLRRLLSLANVQGSSGAGDWMMKQERYLITYLNPSGREAVTRFGRTNSLYQPKRP